MARPRGGKPAPTRPVHKRIGVIGKPNITEYEAACLNYIGRCLAAMGHTLVIVPAPGTVSAVRGGVVEQGGSVEELEADVLTSSDRTLLYPDPRLLERIREKHPDFDDHENWVIIKSEELDEWVDATKQILDGYGINRP